MRNSTRISNSFTVPKDHCVEKEDKSTKTVKTKHCTSLHHPITHSFNIRINLELKYNLIEHQWHEYLPKPVFS